VEKIRSTSSQPARFRAQQLRFIWPKISLSVPLIYTDDVRFAKTSGHWRRCKQSGGGGGGGVPPPVGWFQVNNCEQVNESFPRQYVVPSGHFVRLHCWPERGCCFVRASKTISSIKSNSPMRSQGSYNKGRRRRRRRHHRHTHAALCRKVNKGCWRTESNFLPQWLPSAASKPSRRLSAMMVND